MYFRRAAFLILWAFVFAIPTFGQSLSSKFKPGDEVEFYYLGSWRPATVLETNRTHANLEYEFAGGSHTRVTPKNEVRYTWEANAMTPLRFWSDASGKFKIRAVVMDFDSEAGTVTLFRPDEEKEITLAIKKLSDIDQTKIRTLMKKAPPRAAELPQLVEFQRDEGGQPEWASASDLSGLQPDPPKIEVGVPMGGAGFYRNSSSEKLVGLFPIGSSAGWMVAGTMGTRNERPPRIVWVTLADGKLQKQHPIPDGEALVAVDPANQHVLTYGKDEESKSTTLTLWRCSPKSEKAKPLIRWASKQGKFAWPTSWADFVSPTRVIHQWNKQGYVVWDFELQKAVYTVTQESFFGAKASLSPGRRYLAVPEDKRVRLLDAEDGKTLAVLPIEGGSSSGVAFNADGSKLAIMTRNQLAIWNLGSGSEPRRVRCDAVGSPFTKSIDWVDENSLLVGGDVLFDIDMALPVWRYKPNTWEVRKDSWGSRTISVVGGKYCYSVNVKEGQEGGIVVGAVELPGPMVRDVVESIDPEKLYAIRRGDAVSLDVQCGQYTSRVQAALTAEIQKNGWLLQSNAPFVVEAKMGRGERQSVTYENQMTGEKQSASVVPFTGSVALKRIGAANDPSSTMWQSGSSTGLSPVMFLKKGESAQQKANEQQRPNPEFFDRVDIPEKIFDRRYSGGFGTSEINSRGLTPKPIDNLPVK